MKLGSKVRLKVPCLGNPVGTIGVCYETYDIGWGLGISVIFPNGEYDGFSQEEQKGFLEFVEDTNFSYNFQNVMTLSRDFDKGVFDEVLGINSVKKLYA